ncbi:FAD-dependent tricarballylate dehydrogenase TcuA [Janibacter cremeus]|uniref:FAD-dependent tricarballylate dehydrogenase TcuA n=1 Tax=Janibacter cremeus TaxID=1285192 RepID=UPI0023F8BE46|nr:FAD-dependent tricarballylate dehydrogenase TcuA [Janibacter cremeus]WEV77405.1 FAD-dependent tricarballylate dehydrogenase TcuA [Janibacter cremeus]
MSARTHDVIVVGSGIAGLSSAISAHEAGARVLLLDRATESEAGGNTRYTEAYMRMASVDEPADGLADALVDDFMGHPDPGLTADLTKSWEKRSPLLRAHPMVDLDYVETFVESAGPTLRWLEGHGMSFGQLPTLFLTVSTTRLAPIGGGQALVETLSRRAKELGIDFSYESTVRELVVDEGVVTGVVAATPQGRVTHSGTVVLACGGYEGNAEMMARYHGDKAMTCRPVARGGNYNKGEGLEMALAAGAATAGNFSLFHAEPIDPRSGDPEAAIMAFTYGVLVNVHGRRFVDEARGPIDAWYERTTRDIQAQDRGMAWMILDAAGQAVPNIRTAIRTEEPAVTAGTIEELAAALDLDPTTLVATMDEYNAACPEGEWDVTRPDGMATQGLHPAKSNWARPISQGPFAAYPIMAANVFTFGGLKVDASSRVIDRDGRAIPGLYAAGEMTGLYYSNYVGSTSVLRGATFGRIAGAGAAESRRESLAS